MSTFPWLTVNMAIPAVGALVLAVMPGASAGASEDDQRARNALVKVIALVFSLITLVGDDRHDRQLQAGRARRSSSPRPISGSRSSASTTRSGWTASGWSSSA